MTTPEESAQKLRRQAEGKTCTDEVASQPLSSEEAERLIYELRVHQVELEIQNEELMRTHHDLTAAKARYFDLYDLAPVGYLTVSPEGIIQEANLAATSLFGGFRKDLLRKLITDFIIPEDQHLYYLHRQRTVAAPLEDRMKGCEIRMLRPDSSWFWVYLQDTLTDNEYRIALIDITTRKTSEEALRESEALFHDLFQHHAAVKFVFDPENGRILDANDAAAGFYGWSSEQLKQMRIQEINTLSATAMQEKIQQAREQKNIRFEFQHRRADGSLRDVEVYSSSIRARGKDLLHSIVHDITERKKAEAERELLQTAIEQAGENIFITDSKGIIQYVNPIFVTVTGYRREEAIGRNPRILKSGKHEAPFYQEMWQTLSSGRTWKGRVINKRKDGTFFTELTTISPVSDSNGKIANYVAVKQDITEQLKLEEQFQQAQKMESVGHLAGGVAHDFNNMLSVILGYGNIILETIPPDDPLHECAQEIVNAGTRSASIVRQLLAFARKQTIAPKVLDLNETIEEMLKMIRRLIGEDIALNWQPSSVWPVCMDPSQLDQILANLCVNARDAINGVGKITIETETISIDETYCSGHPGFIPGEFVLLSISDNGIGMDSDTVARIFEPFFTTKEIGKGTGLGLATVYGIVKQNNGYINVSSEPGQGTTFRIYLPRHAKQITASEKKTKDVILRGRGETILVVEDEASVLKLASKILTNLGYVVLVANNPQEAVKLAKENDKTIALLITDVIMPGMNGRDLANVLHALYPNLKCLFMSGYTSNIITDKGVLEEGANFIQKPFSVTDLSAKVDEVLKSDKDFVS